MSILPSSITDAFNRGFDAYMRTAAVTEYEQMQALNKPLLEAQIKSIAADLDAVVQQTRSDIAKGLNVSDAQAELERLAATATAQISQAHAQDYRTIEPAVKAGVEEYKNQIWANAQLPSPLPQTTQPTYQVPAGNGQPAAGFLETITGAVKDYWPLILIGGVAIYLIWPKGE